MYVAYLLSLRCFVYFVFTADSCPDGYYGEYRNKKCSFPTFGYSCQQTCLCSKSRCHFSTGCHIEQNGKLVLEKRRHVETLQSQYIPLSVFK